MWMGGGEEDEKVSHRDKMVDSVMGVRRPTFKRAYNATRLNSNYVYNSITMMMVSHVITAPGHVITALGHMITAPDHVISSGSYDHSSGSCDHSSGSCDHSSGSCDFTCLLPYCSLTLTTHLKSCVSLPQKLNGMFVCM